MDRAVVGQLFVQPFCEIALRSWNKDDLVVQLEIATAGSGRKETLTEMSPASSNTHAGVVLADSLRKNWCSINHRQLAMIRLLRVQGHIRLAVRLGGHRTLSCGEIANGRWVYVPIAVLHGRHRHHLHRHGATVWKHESTNGMRLQTAQQK